MRPRRRTLLAAAALAALGVRLPAHAQLPAPGQDYTPLPQALPVESGSKIEVIEFFWYGCIHCYNFEPALEAWLKKLPADVEFRRIPAIFNDRWRHDAAIFYALEALGQTEKTHLPLFDAIHKSRLDTSKPPPLHEWLGRMGVDVKKFEEAFKSFGVQSRVQRAAQLTAAYRIDGTPALAVHGAFTISAEQGRTPRGMLATVDHLVGVARRYHSQKK